MQKIPEMERRFFTRGLMKWNKLINNRLMPWKQEKDPYKIWLSEIILQQTRVEQGRAYYLRLVERFPNIHTLAAASEKTLFKYWEGLGYYARCRNLLFTAKYISKNCEGIFPDTYEGLRALKGVGPYTAAAIGSFAFGLPYAVVDGNVIRVLSRYFGWNESAYTPAGKKGYEQLAQSLLDKEQPGLYNQAIMDFGATVCKPKGARCTDCPLSRHCVAFRQDRVSAYPPAKTKTALVVRHFQYFLVRHDGKYYFRKRVGQDIWRNLYEPVLIEGDSGSHDTGGTSTRKVWQNLKWGRTRCLAGPVLLDQVLSHRRIEGVFWILALDKPLSDDSYTLRTPAQVRKLPMPVLVRRFLEAHCPELV